MKYKVVYSLIIIAIVLVLFVAGNRIVIQLAHLSNIEEQVVLHEHRLNELEEVIVSNLERIEAIQNDLDEHTEKSIFLPEQPEEIDTSIMTQMDTDFLDFHTHRLQYIDWAMNYKEITLTSIIDYLGPPNNIEEYISDLNNFVYIKLYYEGIVFMFEKHETDSLLFSVEITNNKYLINGIQVGKTKDETLSILKQYANSFLVYDDVITFGDKVGINIEYDNNIVDSIYIWYGIL